MWVVGLPCRETFSTRNASLIWPRKKGFKWVKTLEWDVKFPFSEKATKTEKIFTVNLTVCSYRQIDGEDSSIFLGFLENMNFNIKRNMYIKYSLTSLEQLKDWLWKSNFGNFWPSLPKWTKGLNFFMVVSITFGLVCPPLNPAKLCCSSEVTQ